MLRWGRRDPKGDLRSMLIAGPFFAIIILLSSTMPARAQERAFPIRVWIPIVGSVLPTSIGFDCDWVEENPTAIPNWYRRWQMPEENIPPIVTCDSIFFNTPDPVPIPQQLEELIIPLSGGYGWWCVVSVRINYGPAVAFWHTEPSSGLNTEGYMCPNRTAGCYWIMTRMVDSDFRISHVVIRGNMPMRAFVMCWPMP